MPNANLARREFGVKIRLSPAGRRPPPVPPSGQLQKEEMQRYRAGGAMGSVDEQRRRTLKLVCRKRRTLYVGRTLNFAGTSSNPSSAAAFHNPTFTGWRCQSAGQPD